MKNLAVYSGATAETIQEMEARLKEDILVEGQSYHDMFVAHIETADKSIVPSWEYVSEQTVQTPEEVYAGFAAQGIQFVLLCSKTQKVLWHFPCRIQYERLPLTPEGALKRGSVERLIALIKGYTRGNIHIIFNCQMGQGRSTTAMVLTTMLKMRQLSADPDALSRFVDPFPLQKQDSDGFAPYYRAEYPPVLSLISTIEQGPLSPSLS